MHPGVCRRGLYDGRPAGHSGVQVGTWNLASLSGKEVCEELRKRMIDVCCLQEARWGGQDAGDDRKEI